MLTQAAVGRSYVLPPYEISAEKIREFARAIGDENPWYMDEAAARKAGLPGMVAPPTFCAVFTVPVFAAACRDPEFALDIRYLLHAEQELEFHGLLRPGQLISTVGTIDDVKSRSGLDMLTVLTQSRDQNNELLVTGRWTAVIRSGLAGK